MTQSSIADSPAFIHAALVFRWREVHVANLHGLRSVRRGRSPCRRKVLTLWLKTLGRRGRRSALLLESSCPMALHQPLVDPGG